MELTKEQEQYVQENCSTVDLEEMYKEMLDECCGPIHIGMLEYSASEVLKEVDPTAYRCGMNDHEYHLGLVEIEGEYYMFEDVEEALEEFAELQEEEDEDVQR